VFRLEDGIHGAAALLAGETTFGNGIEGPEGHANQFVTLLHQQHRGHTAVDAAAHCYQHTLCHFLTMRLLHRHFAYRIASRSTDLQQVQSLGHALNVETELISPFVTLECTLTQHLACHIQQLYCQMLGL